MEPSAQYSFLALYFRQLEAVFRYHLVRSGDWTTAQSLTADTFFGALERYHPHRITMGKEDAWLWKIAVGLQARRTPRADGMLFSGETPPSQDQLATFARAAQVHSQWQGLPRPQRDMLAMSYFGGLNPEQIGEVIGGKADQIRETAGQHGSAAVVELARSIHPVGYFQQRLENALREGAGKISKHGLRLEMPVLWQPLYQARGAVVWALRLSVLGMLVYLFATAWTSFQRASRPLPGPAPAPLPTPTPTPEFLFAPQPDELIVADSFDRLRLYSLSERKNGELISEPGFYPNKHLNPKFPPLVSPDGKWLAICRPLQDDTWLLSLDGEGEVQVSEHQVKLAWSPNSLSLVSIDPQRAGWVEKIAVAPPVSAPIFVNGRAQILAAAYSPSGDGIGVAYLEGDQVHLEWLSTNGNADQELASLPAGKGVSASSFDLFFTADGREIWLPVLGSAVTLPEGEVRPLVAEPFADPTGARGQRLGLKNFPPLTENSVLSPDGLNAAAILRRTDNNVPSILTIYTGPWLASQPWMTYYGQIDALAWGIDSSSLFIQREGAEGPAILQVDAQSGNNAILLNQTRLIGTVSDLRQTARRIAPWTLLVKGESTVEIENNLMTAFLPGNQISFRIPKTWRLWTQGDGSPDGMAVAANFSFPYSQGWAALPPGYVMIGITQSERNNSRPLGEQVNDYAGTQPGQAQVKEFNLDGQEAYRLDFLKDDRTREPVVFFRTQNGDVSIRILHGADETNQYFDTLIDSIQIENSQSVSRVENTPQAVYP